MTHRETPSKTNTPVILNYSRSEEIYIEEPQESHKFQPETEVFILHGSRQTTAHLLKHFGINTKIKARSDNVLILLTSLSRLKW